MGDVMKKTIDSDDKITVYSFTGSIIIPTEQGSYFATAVGGVVEARPTGNPLILFSLRYIWDLTGNVSEFPEPIRIRLNTAQAVTETINFKFPDPEVPDPEVPDLKVPGEEPGEGNRTKYTSDNQWSSPSSSLQEEGDEWDDDNENDEGDDNKAEDDDELDKILAESPHSEEELSW
jgi:hypothetical protein